MLHARDLGWEGEPCVPCTPPGGHGDGWEVFPFGDLIRSSVISPWTALGQSFMADAALDAPVFMSLLVKLCRMFRIRSNRNRHKATIAF
jgi:hypothetical protein